MKTERTRIIGVGNPLMGDDGLGCRAIELLQRRELPAGVDLIDAGCAGLQLLPLLENCDRLLLIDAADFSAQPGCCKILHNPDLQQLASPCKPQLGHQLGLAEVLLAAQKMAQLPPLSLYLMQVKSCRPTALLSHEIEQALPALLETICDSLKSQIN